MSKIAEAGTAGGKAFMLATWRLESPWAVAPIGWPHAVVATSKLTIKANDPDRIPLFPINLDPPTVTTAPCLASFKPLADIAPGVSVLPL